MKTIIAILSGALKLGIGVEVTSILAQVANLAVDAGSNSIWTKAVKSVIVKWKE